MRCKLDSTEYARSFRKYPTLLNSTSPTKNIQKMFYLIKPCHLFGTVSRVLNWRILLQNWKLTNSTIFSYENPKETRHPYKRFVRNIIPPRQKGVSFCRIHPKTLFEIAMVLSTNSGSFPSNSHVSATFSIFLRFGESWNPTNCQRFNAHGSLMGRTNLDKSVW